MPIQCVCQICKKKFKVPPSRIKNGGGKYCSNKCLGRANAKKLKGNQHAKGHKPNQGSFKQKHAPWNKGLKGIHLSPGTEFKRGRIGLTHVPIGTVTIRTDKNGKLRRWGKLQNTPRGWVEFARIVWGNQNGEIPTGMVIHHIDQDTLNDDMSNLELLTRAEHARTHNLHNNCT